MLVGNTLYLEEHLNDNKLFEKWATFIFFYLQDRKLRLDTRENMNPRNRLQSYYGYAFESYCTSATPDPRQDPDKMPNGWSGNINTNVQWCSVVKTKLGDHRLIIGGEVDCVHGIIDSYFMSGFVLIDDREIYWTTGHVRRT